MEINYRKVAVVAKKNRGVVPYLQKTLDTLMRLGCHFSVEEEFLADLRVDPKKLIQENEAELYLVLGGDGTFLSIVRKSLQRDLPVAGINLGNLGFLTELKKENLEENLTMLVQNKLPLTKRKLLSLTLNDQHYHALNDIVLHSTDIARVINLGFQVDENGLIELKGDGIIIATPTGSTAYSLSAGGPIVVPEVNAIIITPICPHSLNFRPLIVPDTSTLKIIVLNKRDNISLTIDGQEVIKLSPHQEFKITISSEKLKMFLSAELSYYQLIKEKLSWGT